MKLSYGAVEEAAVRFFEPGIHFAVPLCRIGSFFVQKSRHYRLAEMTSSDRGIRALTN